MDSGPNQTLWGIDLGGTKIEGVILDAANHEKIAHRVRIPTEAAQGYHHVMERIAHLIGRLETESGILRPRVIGIGTPGVAAPSTGLLRNSNTACLNGQPLRSDLERRLGVRVVMANDANCFTLAEALIGSARGYRTVFGIIMGTGVGGGIVTDGRILPGRHGICGEWGHNPLPGEDMPCYCGGRGCVENVISGPALEGYFHQLTGRSESLPVIARLYRSGDPEAGKTLERLRGKFGQALAAVVNILDPDAIVIGGGVGNIPLLYGEETRDAVLQHLFNDRFDTPILSPLLGDSAGVFGAAMLSDRES